jgi:hypothetical protein
MKITRKQLRKLILKEFRINPKYQHYFDSPGDGDLPPIEMPERGGGGGRQKLHQLIRINIDNDKKYDPNSYITTPVDLTLLSQMMDIYASLSDRTKQAMYKIAGMPEDMDPNDDQNLRRLVRLFFDIYQPILDNVPQGPYDLFSVYHPNFKIIDGTFDLMAEVEASITQLDKLKLYEKVTGYEANKDLLHNYELIMYSCGSLI